MTKTINLLECRLRAVVPNPSRWIEALARLVVFASVSATLPGCGADGATTVLQAEPGTASRSVTQSGPQDIGEFRAIVARGEVPSVGTLDEVGFFNEHALDLPPADCGDSVCFHPMLAVAPRFDGGNWAMAFLAMNTSVDPSQLTIGPRRIAFLIEHSTLTRSVLGALDDLPDLVSDLPDDARVSLVLAGREPSWEVTEDSPDALPRRALPTSGSAPARADLHAALTSLLAHQRRTASDGDGSMLPPLQVLMVTSGHTSGIDDPALFSDLAAALAEANVVVSSFEITPGASAATLPNVIPAGAGGGSTGPAVEARTTLARDVSSVTSGNSAVVVGASDLGDALRVAIETTLVPIAKDLTLEVRAATGYGVGATYGTEHVDRGASQATLRIPRLYVGARTGSQDVGTGRRGGGGGYFVELISELRPDADLREVDAFYVTASYTDHEGRLVERTFTRTTPYDVGGNPPPDAPFFSDPERAKPFMMLNMYLALRTATSLFETGDCAAAGAIEPMMTSSYELWDERFDDPDIDADYELLRSLHSNVLSRCDEPVEVGVPQGRIFPMSCFWW